MRIFESTLSDCPPLTGRMYRKLVKATWPVPRDRLPTIVNYAFLTDVAKHQAAINRINASGNLYGVYPIPPQWYANVAFGISSWTAACRGKVILRQVAEEDISDTGAVFAWCLFKAMNNGVDLGANLITHYDSAGHIQKSFTCLQPFLRSFSPDEVKWTLAHEVGHVLGFQHSHEILELKRMLEQHRGAAACSVMAYAGTTRPDGITLSSVNRCNNTDVCGSLGYTMYPGAHDHAVCDYAYGGEEHPMDHSFAMTRGAIIGTANGITDGVLSNLRYNNHVVMSKSRASAFSGIIVSAMMLWLLEDNAYRNTFLFTCGTSALRIISPMSTLITLSRYATLLAFLTTLAVSTIADDYKNESRADSFYGLLFMFGMLLVSNLIGNFAGKQFAKQINKLGFLKNTSSEGRAVVSPVDEETQTSHAKLN